MSLTDYSMQKFPTVAINATVTEAILPLLTEKPHLFIGIYFLDGNGDRVMPGAGTITSVKLASVNNPGAFESVSGTFPIAATSNIDGLSAQGNFTSIEVITDSITTATQMVIVLSANGA